MKKLITLLVAAFAAFSSVRAEEYPDISITDLKKALAEKKVVVLDANGSDSWKEGHVPTAHDFETVEADLAKKLPADKATLVVAYCGGPGCNAYKSAADAAKKLGYTNVKHLSAGISGWKKAGEKTEAAEAPAKKTTTAAAGAQTYVATFTGVTCAGCKAHVTEAIAKLPGGSKVSFEAGEGGTQKVTFTADSGDVCKDKLVEALGESSKIYVVQDLKVAAR